MGISKFVIDSDALLVIKAFKGEWRIWIDHLQSKGCEFPIFEGFFMDYLLHRYRRDMKWKVGNII